MKEREMATGRSEHCRVVVKARPTFQHEQEASDETLKLELGKVVLDGSRTFVADRVYLPHHGDAVYADEVKALTSSMRQGINATIFAYGASGSGKTYTVLGEKRGIVDRVAEDLFEHYNPHTCKLTVMVEELYEDAITDLLLTVQSAKPIGKPASAPTPRKQQMTSRYTCGASELEVSSSEHLSNILRKSLLKRRTAATNLNDDSSRSHVVVTLTLTQQVPLASHSKSVEPAAVAISNSNGSSRAQSAADSSPTHRSSSRPANRQQVDSGMGDAASDSSSEAESVVPVTTYLIGKLYLVDLAGSENVKRSGADGQQLKEACTINTSLFHLKTIIECIHKKQKVSTYRNSTLTYCLRHALGGGNSKLLIIACISTAISNLRETKETLLFAEKAKSVTNAPVVNTQPKDVLISRLEHEILVLQDQLQLAAKGSHIPQEILQRLNTAETACAQLEVEKEAVEQQLAAERAALQEQVVLLQQQLEQTVAQQAQETAAAKGREAQLQLQVEAARASVADLQAAAVLAKVQVAQLQQSAAELSMFKQAATSTEQSLRLQLAETEGNASRALAAAQEQTSSLQQQLQAQEAAQQKQVQRLMVDNKHLVSDLATSRSQLADSSRSCASLQQQLEVQQATTDAARKEVLDQKQEAQQLQQMLHQHVNEIQQLQVQVKREQQKTALLMQQLQAQQSAQAETVAAMLAAHADMQQCSDQMLQLQQQLKQQQSVVQQVHRTYSGCVGSAENLTQQLASQDAQIKSLQQTLERQQKQQEAEREAAAQEALHVATQQQQERESWQQALDAAKASIAQLQQQSAADAAAHAEEISRLKQQHQEELNAALQHTVQKANTEKLRCKQHLALQVQTIISDALSMSEALADDLGVHMPVETPVVTPTGSRQEHVMFECMDSADVTSPREQLIRAAAPEAEQQVQSSAEGSEESSLCTEGTVEHEQQEEDESQHDDDDIVSAEEAVSQDAGSEETPTKLDNDSDDADGSSDEDYDPAEALEPKAECHTPDALASVDSLNKQAPAQQFQRRTRSAARDRSNESPQGCLSAAGRTPGLTGLASPEPADSPVVRRAAAVPSVGTAETPAAQATTDSGSAAKWPDQYLEKGLVDEAVAANCFAAVTGNQQLNVVSLKAFLAGRKLGNQEHKLVWATRRKRKHHLVQDFMAWYKYHQLALSAAGPGARVNTAIHMPDSPAPAATPGPTWEQLEQSPCAVIVPAAATTAVGPCDRAVLVCTPSPLQSRTSSGSGGGAEIINLCTPVTDRSKAGAAAAADARTPDKRTPSSLGRLREKLTFKISGKRVEKKAHAAAAAEPQGAGDAVELVTSRSTTHAKHLSIAAAAAVVDTVHPSDTQQQMPDGPLAVAAGGASAVAEGVVDACDHQLATRSPNHDSSSLAGSSRASSLSATERFLLDNCSPGSHRLGADGRVEVSLDEDRLQAAGGSSQSQARTGRVAGGFNAFSYARRGIDIKMSRSRR